MELVLSYQRARNRRELMLLEPDITEVILRSKQIEEIDLTPLAKCEHLERLDLSDNMIHEIDLWPLMRCTRLREVSLKNNQITTLDVSPLFYCPEMRTVQIDNWVQITASRDYLTSIPRPQPLDVLRRERHILWMSGNIEEETFTEIENTKNEVFLQLASTYFSPDNRQIVDEMLKHYVSDEVGRRLTEKLMDAEARGDYRRVSILQRCIEYMNRGRI